MSAGATPDRAAATVALARLTGLDAPGLAERLQQEDAQDALAHELGAGHSLLPADPAEPIAEARALIAGWERRGLRCLTPDDPDYPPALQTVHDRPVLLWLAGDPALVRETAPGVAVVGTRHPTEGGRTAAAAIATDLVRGGITVISGLATGIDTVAHRAALAAGGRTVAVIGCGHDHAYPPVNAELQTMLAREHAVVSPFWPGDRPAPARFRRRNGVMSGLSAGTVIVEASARSGTRVQARLALTQGRPVVLRRQLLGQSWAAELARRPGVHVVDTATELIAIVRTASDSGPITARAAAEPRDRPDG